MTDHGSHTGRGRAKIDNIGGRFAVLRDDAGENNGADTFGKIDKENRISKLFSKRSSHVCGADIAATDRSNVDASDSTGYVTRWKRSEQVADSRDEDNRAHF